MTISEALFATRHLVLEPIQNRHFCNLLRLQGDRRVMRHIPGGTRSREQVASAIERYTMHWSKFGHGMWSVFCGKSVRFLGIAGLQRAEEFDGVHVAMLLFQEPRKFDVALEAFCAAAIFGFEHLDVQEVFALTRSRNSAALKLLERTPFRRAQQSRVVFGGVRQQLYHCDRFAFHEYLDSRPELYIRPARC